MAVIGGKVSSYHPKNLNHVHKDSKYFLYVIINLGKDISGDDTVLYDGVETYDLGSRAHISKSLHRRMIFGPLKQNPIMYFLERI